MQTVRREVVVSGSPLEVWPAITDPAAMSEWFGARVESQQGSGGRITFTFPDGSSRGAVVEEAVPGQRFVFRWLPFEQTASGRVPVPGGRVEIELRDHEQGTAVAVAETCLAAEPIPAPTVLRARPHPRSPMTMSLR